MLKNLTLQAAFFVAVFLLISWFRESSLLATDGEQALPVATVETLSGHSVMLSQLHQQPTLYYFWAPWCSVCKLSMPNLQAFYEAQLAKPEAERIEVIAIALSYDSKQEVYDFLADRKFQFTSVLGNVETGAAFKIKGFPTYYFADKNGYLVSKSMGYSTEIGMFLRTLNL